MLSQNLTEKRTNRMIQKRLLGKPSLLLITLVTFSPLTILAQRTQSDKDPSAIFQKALELKDNNKYASAQKFFEDYREVGEDKIKKSEALFHQARCAMELFQKQTEHLFKKYVRKYPEMGKKDLAYFNLGKYHFRQKALQQATQWLKEINPDNLSNSRRNEYHFMLGYSYYKDEEYDKAKPNLASIMKEPNAYYAPGNYYYGYIAYIRGKYETAIKRFKKIQDDEKFGKVVPVYITQFNLLSNNYEQTIKYGKEALARKGVGKKQEIKSYVGQAYFHEKQFDKVIKHLSPLRESDLGLDSEQRYGLGFAFYKKGEYDKAADLFESIEIQADSIGQNIAYHLGQIYVKNGKKEQARNSFDYAANLDFDPKLKKRSAFHFAKLSFDLDYQQTATQKLQAFIKKYPESDLADKAQSLLGDILLTTKNYKEALGIIEKIDDPNREMLEAYQKIAYQRGLELYQDKAYKEARQIFVKALNDPINPKFKALSYFWLGETYYKLKAYEKASREFQNFLYQDKAPETPFFTVAYYNLGYADYKQDNFKKARKHFKEYTSLEQTVKDDKRFIDVLARIADCYFAKKSYDPAIKYYSKVIQEGGNPVPYALYQKGILQGLKGNNEEKIKTLKTLSQEYGQSQYVDDALFEIGDVYFRQADYQLAINQFNYLLQDYPQSDYFRSAKLKIALIRYNKGKDSQAIDQFQQIVRDYPYSNEAKQAIDQLKTIYTDQGRADSLIAFLETIESADLSASFKDSTTYFSAFSYIRRNDCRGAIQAFEDYLDQYPKGFFSIKAHYYLAECAREENIPGKAIRNYEKVVEREASQFMEASLSALSSLYFKQEGCDQALEYYNQLSKEASKKRNQLKALTGQVRCNFKLGYLKSARKKARQLMSLAAASKEQKTQARYYLAKVYYEEEKWEKAAPLLAKVYKANKGEIGAESKYLEASVLYEQGKYEAAQNMIYELKDNFTNYNYWVAKGFILLGDVFVQQDKDFQAKNTLKSVEENFPGEELTNIASQKLEKIKKREAGEEQKETMEPDTLNQIKDE